MEKIQLNEQLVSLLEDIEVQARIKRDEVARAKNRRVQDVLSAAAAALQVPEGYVFDMQEKAFIKRDDE